jgi:hypothetical protein
VLATVFVTQTGTRYHARVDLPCMEKAHGHTEIPIEAAADGGLVPCATCGAPPLPGTTELDRQWLSAISDWAREGVFESFWEQAFARRVLAQTAGINVDDVEPQALISAAGETYKVDFSIPKAGLVLEVDGYHKDGTPPTQSDLDRRNRRDAALQSRGLTVLHFSNAQVQQQPGICRDLVAQAVASRTPSPTAPTPVPPAASSPMPATAPSPPPAPPTMPTAAPAQAAPRTSNRGVLIGIGVAAAVVFVLVAAAIAVIALVALGGDATDQRSQPPALASPEASGPSATGATNPVDRECPAGYDIRGNINDEGERIAHSPGDQFYEKTIPERCFADLETAEAEGYRPARQ